MFLRAIQIFVLFRALKRRKDALMNGGTEFFLPRCETRCRDVLRTVTCGNYFYSQKLGNDGVDSLNAMNDGADYE